MASGLEASGERAGQGLLSPAALGFGRLFESMRDAVVVSDDEGNVRLWNPGATALFGYSPREAARLNVRDLVPEEYRAQHEAGMRRYAQTGHGPYIDSSAPLELPALRKDGARLVVELTLAPMEVAGARYALAIVRDVTERATLRAELVQRNAALTEANEGLEAFAYVVSHDLKEPVRALSAYGLALEEEHASDMPEEARFLLGRMTAAADRLGRLVDGLLEFSRAGQETARPEPMGVREALAHPACGARLESAVRERDARVEVLDGPRVVAAAPLLCQAIGNVVLNAVRHNPKDAPRVRVSSRPHPDDPRLVEVDVEDDGPGFPPAVVDGFERARRSRPLTLRGGFGLSIARRAVERMGGRMSLGRSEALGGAKVALALPAAGAA